MLDCEVREAAATYTAISHFMEYYILSSMYYLSFATVGGDFDFTERVEETPLKVSAKNVPCSFTCL